jgi:hypothetical protein
MKIISREKQLFLRNLILIKIQNNQNILHGCVHVTRAKFY